MVKVIYEEKKLEAYCRVVAKQHEVLALKFVSVSLVGLPDRIFLIPGGKICFAEFKTTGKKLSKIQERVRTMLLKLGFKYFVVDDLESRDELVKHLINEATV